MTEILFDDFDGVQNAVSLAATSTYRRFFDYCEREDLVGVGWEWACQHTEQVNTRLLKDDEGRDNARFLRMDLTRCMEKYARSEKAAWAGYNSRDEYQYAKATIEMALPAILTDSYDPPQRPARGEGGTKSDPAESGGWLAVRADVSRAWEQVELTDEQREAVVLVYRDGYEPREACDMLGITATPLAERIDRAMRRMIDHLSTPARDNRVEQALRKRPRGTAQVQEQWT